MHEVNQVGVRIAAGNMGDILVLRFPMFSMSCSSSKWLLTCILVKPRTEYWKLCQPTPASSALSSSLSETFKGATSGRTVRGQRQEARVPMVFTIVATLRWPEAWATCSYSSAMNSRSITENKINTYSASPIFCFSFGRSWAIQSKKTPRFFPWRRMGLLWRYPSGL